LEHALQVVENRPGRAEYVAIVQSILARALMDAGQPERALPLALEARTTYSRAPVLHAIELAQLDALLKHRTSATPAAPPVPTALSAPP
jgi:hypothetical protein